MKHPASIHGLRGRVNAGMLLVIGLFALSAGGAAWVSVGIVAHDRWPIRWLEVNGAFQRVSAEQVRASLTPLVRGSFFTANVGDLRDYAAGISWVESVRVEKRWPDTIVVHIGEFEPFAHWNRGRLISSNGAAFAVPEADGIQGLPWLYGPEDQLDTMLSRWVRYNEMLASAGLEIRELHLDRRGAWSMLLDNGTRVRLGRDAATERLQRLLAGWDFLLHGRPAPPSVVDLRYTNGIAVNWPSPAPELKESNS